MITQSISICRSGISIPVNLAVMTQQQQNFFNNARFFEDLRTSWPFGIILVKLNGDIEIKAVLTTIIQIYFFSVRQFPTRYKQPRGYSTARSLLSAAKRGFQPLFMVPPTCLLNHQQASEPHPLPLPGDWEEWTNVFSACINAPTLSNIVSAAHVIYHSVCWSEGNNLVAIIRLYH